MAFFLRFLLVCCMITGLGQGRALAQLVADFSMSSSSGCDPMAVTFTSTSTGTNASTTYTWNLGNGASVPSQPMASTTYNIQGGVATTYSITLTVANGSVTSSKTQTITVYPAPTVSFTASPLSGCPPLPVAFTNTSNPNMPGTATYTWSFGNGASSTSQNATTTYQGSGFYSVSLKVDNAGGCSVTYTDSAMIEVYTQPLAGFVSDTVICGASGTMSFTNTTTGVGPFTSSWDFGDGGTSTANNPTHTFNGLGTYNVRLIVTDSRGCKDTIQRNIKLVMPPTAAFTGPDSVCTNQAVQFVSTTNPSSSNLAWTFGNGGAGSGNPVFTTYGSAGTYTVQLVAGFNGCFDTVQKNIVIKPQPNIAITGSPLQPCPAPATVTFTNNTTSATSYTWSFGDGQGSTAANPVHTYQNDGFYTVKLVAVSDFGCVDSAQYTNYVKIYPLELDIEATPHEGCIPLPVNFSYSLTSFDYAANQQVAYPYGVDSVKWDFGDGSPTSSQNNPSHTYTAVGNYTVSLTVYMANGCSKTQIMTVEAGTKPVANFTASPLTVCVNGYVYFNNQSSGATEYEWAFGDGNISNLQNPVHQYQEPGDYTVVLIADFNGCKDTLIRTNYIHVNFPKSRFGVDYSCDTLTKARFSNNSLGYNRWKWYFGDGDTSNVLHPEHVYPALGTYIASLVTWNDTTGCKDSLTTIINLIDLEPGILASDTAICLQDSLTLYAQVSGGTAIRYDWILDNSVYLMDTTAILGYRHFDTGYHTVSLIITDEHNCRDTITKTNFILVGQPFAGVTVAPDPGCAPVLVTFTDQTHFVSGTSAVSRYWDFGNGNTVSGNNTAPTQLFSQAGQYDLMLVVTDNIGCSDTLYRPGEISIHKPEADFIAIQPVYCAGQAVSFLNNSLGAPFTSFWDFGDGTTSTAASPSHTYTQNGVYTVTLVVTDTAGCSDTLVRPSYITILAKPVAAFTMSDTFTVCPTLLVQFTNQSTGGNGNYWIFGNGNTSTLANPTNVYNSGIYYPKLIVSNSVGCKDTAEGKVRVMGYAGVLSYNPLLGCAPLTVNFTANTTNIPGFIYDFNDGSTFTTSATTATHTYTQPGRYVPRLIMSDNKGCSSTSMGLDTIKVDGVIPGFTHLPYPACESGTLTFIDTSKGLFSTVVSRLWEFHSGATSTAQSPTHYYSGPGTYPIKLITTTSTGCRDTANLSVTIHSKPVISAGPDTTICVGDAATLMPSGGVSYTWSPAGTLSCTNCTNPQASPLAPTMYIVSGTDSNGCRNTDSVLVMLKTHTAGVFDTNRQICEGEQVMLHASGGHTYTWLPASGLDNNKIANPKASPTATTQYMVIIQEGSCIPDTGFVLLTVHPSPHVSAGPDQTIIAGNNAQILATAAGNPQWAWTPATGLSCDDCPDPQASPPATTTYTVVATSDMGCSDTDRITIKVICQSSQLFIPNTFTPDENGVNDRFYPRGRGIDIIKTFRIYNRWGQLLFERTNIVPNDINSGWDGTFNGKPLNSDVFVFTIDGTCSTGEDFSWQGDITLLR